MTINLKWSIRSGISTLRLRQDWISSEHLVNDYGSKVSEVPPGSWFRYLHGLVSDTTIDLLGSDTKKLVCSDTKHHLRSDHSNKYGRIDNILQSPSNGRRTRAYHCEKGRTVPFREPIVSYLIWLFGSSYVC